MQIFYTENTQSQVRIDRAWTGFFYGAVSCRSFQVNEQMTVQRWQIPLIPLILLVL